jgi:hypothetical protein
MLTQERHLLGSRKSFDLSQRLVALKGRPQESLLTMQEILGIDIGGAVLGDVLRAARQEPARFRQTPLPPNAYQRITAASDLIGLLSERSILDPLNLGIWLMNRDFKVLCQEPLKQAFVGYNDQGFHPKWLTRAVVAADSIVHTPISVDEMRQELTLQPH